MMSVHLRQRVFACLLPLTRPRYDRVLGPLRREILAGVRGSVVEFGPGDGVNLDYLPEDVAWLGLEPNPILHRRLQTRIASRPTAQALQRAATDSGLPDRSADVVVATLLLCSVADPPAVLSAARRLLRPGGRYVFLEHVAAPTGTATRRWQRRLRPVFGCLGDGCAPDRETAAYIAAAGFRDVRLQQVTLPLPVVGPHIYGHATA